MRPRYVVPLVALAVGPAVALNNGVGRLPGLGWSSWYCSPHGSQVTSEFVKANAAVLVSSGLADKGYVYVNVDEVRQVLVAINFRHQRLHRSAVAVPCRGGSRAATLMGLFTKTYLNSRKVGAHFHF